MRKASASKPGPGRSRGQEIFSSVLEAAWKLFDQIGFEKISTNKIAERAGVSIGSLYQYFTNKDSVLGVILEKTTRGTLDAMRTIVDAPTPEPREKLNQIIQLYASLFYENPRLSRAVFLHYQRIGMASHLSLVHREAADIIAGLLISTRPHSTPKERRITAYTAVHSFIGLIYWHLSLEQVTGDDTQDPIAGEDLMREAATMLNAYLFGAPRHS